MNTLRCKSIGSEIAEHNRYCIYSMRVTSFESHSHAEAVVIVRLTSCFRSLACTTFSFILKKETLYLIVLSKAIQFVAIRQQHQRFLCIKSTCEILPSMISNLLSRRQLIFQLTSLSLQKFGIELVLI